MTIKYDLAKILTPQQIQEMKDYNFAQAQTIAQAAPSTKVPDGDFVFFACFDGTNNDANQKPLTTNVHQLYTQGNQATSAGNKNLFAGYYNGPGSQGTQLGSSVVPT